MKNNLFYIAEISANHNNDIDLALRTIEAIAQTGAHAVKVQTYTADSLVLNVDNEYFGPRKDGLWKGRSLYELYQEGSLPFEWHEVLKEKAESLGLVFFSSPFSKKDVDFLETLHIPMYKIASMEINDIPLIEYVASKGKPMILSTGVASLADIELAVETCRKMGNNDITLLKCTSEYPAKVADANLRTIPNLKATFDVKVGLSDHTMGSTVPVVAVALGATVIEKHFILSRDLGGIDAAFSMEPDEFKEMVDECNNAFLALGKVDYTVAEKNKYRRRSLFIARDVKKGETITEENIRSVRPGNGMHPKFFKDMLGKKFSRDFNAGEPFTI